MTNRKKKDRPPMAEFLVSQSKSSKIQEFRLSEDIKGQRTPASGAFDGHKGDSENDTFLVDAKLTEKKSFALSEKVLAKIDKEALAYGKIPAVALEFTNFRHGVTNKWAVIPYSIFVKIARSTQEEGA